MSGRRERVVILDAATYGDISLQRFLDRWDCRVYQTTSAAQTIERIAGHAIAITNKVVFSSEMLSSPETRGLKLIAVAATGTDIIDKQAAAQRGIAVCNVPGYAGQSVAQFTIALLLQLATSVANYAAAVKNGEWQRSPIFSLLDFPTIELTGKKLGIIGYGNIGKAVAQMARGFGMEILVGARPGDRNPTAERTALDQVFRQADFVTLHCPLTPETKQLINEQTLAMMKPGAFLINTARGALIDEPALIEALRAKRIAGAALDVITQEPPPANHPIIRAAQELNNLVVTPHTAWSAREARERLLQEVEENILSFLRGQPRNIVA
jgi:glycerate dehydrogenase